MPELTAVYEGKHTGPLPRINRRYGARVVNGHAILFEAAEFRRHKKNMGVSFCATRKGAEPIDYPVDANIIVSMWKMKDSDAPIKAIFDALQEGGILINDRLIRHFTVTRLYHPRDAVDSVVVKLYTTRLGGEG